MGTADVFAARLETEARIVEDREVLWRIALRAALLCARARDLCRRSHWEARRAERRLRERVLRHAVSGSTRAPRKRARRRSVARLVAVPTR